MQKFDSDGGLLMRIGVYGAFGNDESRDRLGTPTAVCHDRERREIFVSDGYRNHRVIAFDASTGEFTRMWGAYGGPFQPPRAQSEGTGTPVHDICRGPDGLYYVCDRIGNRIQVFEVPQRGAPRFVREISIAPETTFAGSAFAAVFSACGRYIYVPDGSNERVWVIDIEDGAVLGWSSSTPEEGWTIIIWAPFLSTESRWTLKATCSSPAHNSVSNAGFSKELGDLLYMSGF